MSVSRIILYCTSTSLSFSVSRTMFPFSSSTMSTSSGLAMRLTINSRSCDIEPAYSMRRVEPPPPPAGAKENSAPPPAASPSLWYRSHTSTCQ